MYRQPIKLIQHPIRMQRDIGRVAKVEPVKKPSVRPVVPRAGGIIRQYAPLENKENKRPLTDAQKRLADIEAEIQKIRSRREALQEIVVGSLQGCSECFAE